MSKLAEFRQLEKHLAEQLIQHLDIKPVDYTAGARLLAMEGGRR